MTRVIIPCAGFGKRVGEPPAKELLILKGEDAPLIKWGLDLIEKSHMLPIIVSRRDKKELLTYLENISATMPFELELIESSKEWPDTILKSQKYWSSKNIVLLPDTRFAPLNILAQMDQALEKSDLVFATFDVPTQDFSTWGALDFFENSFFISEKPSQKPKGYAYAWGLFGFRKEFGHDLLSLMLESNRDHLWKRLNTTSIAHLPLTFFEDVTRDFSRV